MRPPEPPSEDRSHNPETSKSHSSDGEDLMDQSSGKISDEPELERILFVPTSKVGYLIGHHGRTIWGFESSTKAKIDILRPNSRDSETPIRVSGPEANVRHAVRLIMDLYGVNNFTSQHWQCDQSGARMVVASQPVVKATEELVISQQFAAFLIQNEYICYIEAESGAQVLICRQPDEHHHHYGLEENPDKVYLNVIGTAECNGKAIELINQHLQIFEARPDLIELYKNSVNVKIVPDNPFKKFGRAKRIFWRKQSLDYDPNSSTSGGNNIDWPPEFHPVHPGDSKTHSPEKFESLVELIIFSKHFQDSLLPSICRYNNVTMETFTIDGSTKYSTSKVFPDELLKSYEGRSGRIVVIRGCEPNVKNAKLEILREVELARQQNSPEC